MSNALANRAAFLTMIAHSEGTESQPDPYRVCYGYRHTIRDLSDHPAVTGEWHGEPLDSLGPEYAGKVSTAAGRYQQRRVTWLEVKAALKLPDFSPESQDRAALWLIEVRHQALEAVDRGDVASAVYACRHEWASLAGAAYGQPERTLSQLAGYFIAAGGNRLA